MKRILLRITSILFLLSLAACDSNLGKNQSGEEKEEMSKIVISAPKSPAIFSSILLAEEHKQVDIINWETNDTLMNHLQTEEAQFFTMPLNIAANLYAKGIDLQLLQVNTWGSMYLTSTNAKDISDLKNETVFVPSEGGPPDILTAYFMDKYDIENVNIQTMSLSEIGQQISTGKVKHAVLPEPMLSSFRSNVPVEIHRIFNFNQAWQQEFDVSLPQAGIFILRDRKVELEEDISWFQQQSKTNMKTSEQKPDDYLSLLSIYFETEEKVMEEALQKSSISFTTAEDAQQSVESYFELLLDYAPDSIGGELPDAEFYYNVE